MIDELSFQALLLSFKLSITTTVCLLIIGTPIAFWLATSRCRFKFIIEALIALPLVLPPTVLGFYLLILLNPNSFIGSTVFKLTGETILFSFSGLVIGSIVYSFPYVTQPLTNAFASIDKNIIETAKVLNTKPLDRFIHIVLPMAKRGFMTASVLGFAHTLGEFGVVLMLGGNIPNKTQVVSIAIYDHVESLNYLQAHWLAGILLVISFVLLLFIFKINHSFNSVVKL
ncbi:Molybdenum transport system permease protein modB [Phocoenobacter uteri]|uniref:Molybdenum transport system permease n=1 Tax=Phocoenobacter uteri TaxID=146806 RepID=A0A379C9W7_9PAST|nr:molybdate ABC transporter permease subunit [Phocoenobacter uteri]MDG6882300.1 molybdenum ABC transporter permease subunit [Phocoenobacter uteri]SUB58457.1 Molybdenum transport system permease protein modB [Phocoenobacter uteri]